MSKDEMVSPPKPTPPPRPSTQLKNYLRLQGPAGELRIRWNGTGGLFVVIRGQGEEAFAQALVDQLEAAKSVGRVTMFVDLTDMKNFDQVLRTMTTDWLLKNREHVARLSLHAQSPVVLTGVSVANVVLQGLIQLEDERGAIVKAARELGLELP